MANNSKFLPINHLGAFISGSDDLNAVIETPKGSRNKYKYDPKNGLFKLHQVLPAGAGFPYDFGFIPSTLGADGDPLDVMILMDQPAFVGCVLDIRLIGVIEAEQTENGKTERNDRLVAVAAMSHDHRTLRSLKEMDSNLIKEIEHFFASYDKMEGKKFKTLGTHGPKRAARLVAQGVKAFKHEGKPA